MKSFVWGAVLFCVPVSLGCGGGSKNLKADNKQLENRVAELRARSRAARQRIRDLENEALAAREAREVPTDEVIVARAINSSDNPTYVPSELPVESAFAERGEVEVVGFDENGVEILYAGDALRAGSYRPKIDKYDLSASRVPAQPESVPSLPTDTPVIEVINKPLPSVRSLVTDGTGADVENPSLDELPPSNSTVKTAYKQAFAILDKGDHDAAVAAFKDFLAKYPKSEFSDNAQYWLAEAHYDQKQYNTALVEFHRVVDRYPTGNKVPDALLKISFCHIALGDKAAARAFLRNLVKYHPTSNSAALASGKLQGLSE